PEVMVANLSVPSRTVPEFIGYAKANPGKLVRARRGGYCERTQPASPDVFDRRGHGGEHHLHLSTEQGRQYRGDAAIRHMQHVDAGHCCRTSRPWVSSCRATSRASGMASARPRTSQPQVIHKLNKEINAALDDPKMKARLADLGGTPLPGTPAQFGKLI